MYTAASQQEHNSGVHDSATEKRLFRKSFPKKATHSQNLCTIPSIQATMANFSSVSFHLEFRKQRQNVNSVSVECQFTLDSGNNDGTAIQCILALLQIDCWQRARSCLHGKDLVNISDVVFLRRHQGWTAEREARVTTRGTGEMSARSTRVDRS